jgi:uncharacterized protein YoxC
LESNTIDLVIATAMAVMAMAGTLVACGLVFLMMQGQNTLKSIERLSNTLNDEVGPTAVELREVMHGVNRIRSITEQRVNEVGHKVEGIAGSVTQATSTAQKQSTIFGTGLWAGLKEYLTGKNDHEDIHQQVSMDRGVKDEQQ